LLIDAASIIWRAEARDSQQQFGRIDVGAHRARFRRGLQQVLKRRSKLFLEIARQRPECRIARVQRHRKATLGRNEINVALEPRIERITDSLRVKAFPEQMGDDRNLDAVEQLVPIAERAGLSLTHMAMAFVMAHPGVTSAILGPRTMQQLDDLLAGADVALSDEVLDQIDEIVAPGADSGPMGALYAPPALTQASLRRRPAAERRAA
jgi:hypothetical protein